VFLNPFLPGNYAEWYYNGALVAGHNGQTLPSQGPGVYRAWSLSSEGYPRLQLRHQLTLRSRLQVSCRHLVMCTTSQYSLKPSNGSFAVRASVSTPGDVAIRITDVLGRDSISEGTGQS
jgi:hypothetical protein